MIQVKTFLGGGGVIHGITGDFKGRVSAWFRDGGEIHDAEQLRNGAAYPVRRNGPIWKAAQSAVYLPR